MTESTSPITQKGPENLTLKASVRDGVSHAAMMGAGESYIGPFGIFLGATTLQVGLLDTLPQLFGALMQFVGARTMPWFRSRRAVILIGVIFQALLWIPMALLPVSLVFRILNEENVLRENLEGYKEYCLKTRYRLIPYIW